MSNIVNHNFSDGQELAVGLADHIAKLLREAIVTRGHALLAVSGGSTPKRFFEQLSRAKLDWSRVQVTLVDERWVPETSERSNARLVKATLLQHEAAAATFVPLYQDAPTPEEGMPALEAAVAALALPFDAVVLGMGGDGHTASFFPGGDRLADALDLAGTARVIPMRAEGAGEPRITFTLPALLRTRALFLHIEGEPKRRVLIDAQLGTGDGPQYPVHAVLAQDRVPVFVYWCR
jgi:6-phosphogluconolactonase